jgi:predicted glutamine amidotransferase
MSGGAQRVAATFWLLEAPDSLTVQSHRDPDGTGLGFFEPDGTPALHRWPLAAFEDREFLDEAKEVESHTFIAHIRHATTGSVEEENTHPFEQHGRLFAHNGLLQGLEEMDAELDGYGSLVVGDTDSERLFALITRQIERHSGDVTRGLVAAMKSST